MISVIRRIFAKKTDLKNISKETIYSIKLFIKNRPTEKFN